MKTEWAKKLREPHSRKQATLNQLLSAGQARRFVVTAPGGLNQTRLSLVSVLKAVMPSLVPPLSTLLPERAPPGIAITNERAPALSVIVVTHAEHAHRSAYSYDTHSSALSPDMVVSVARACENRERQ